MNLAINNIEREKLSQKSLLGVSIGDAFGDSFFGDEEIIMNKIGTRKIPESTWEFTDDTVMSIAVFDEIRTNGDIDQNSLIKRFCANHDLDINRGYGATVRRILREIGEGGDWREISKSAFDGNGSMGNGAAMRVCPIGAYHFDNLEKVKILAKKSAETTHSNIEAISGAIAIAVGTALCTQMKVYDNLMNASEFIKGVLNELPESNTKYRIAKSLTIPYDYHIATLRKILGNGTEMTSQDTVPFVIWCTAFNLRNFEEALWKGVSILGDRDTICAMIGGMTIMSSDENNIPENWKESVEKIEQSVFKQGNGW